MDGRQLLLIVCSDADGEDVPVDEGVGTSALRPSPSQLISEYSIQATTTIEQGSREFESQWDKASANCRSKSDAPAMLELLTKVSVGRPVTTAGAWNPDLTSQAIVVCTMAEAVEIFHQGPLRMPVLVKEASESSSRMTISNFLDTLSMRDSLDIHDFSKPLEKHKDGQPINVHMPDRYPSAEVVRIFNERRTSDGLPVNLLNLGCQKENAVPAYFSNNRDYDPMHMRTDNGKLEQPEWRDLDNCLVFHLLTSKGAAHLQHVDSHGVYTTALTEVTRKLWLVWLGLELEDLETHEVPDGGVAILIDEGDMLIQPTNILHVPITLEDMLITGTMYWHSSHLLDILSHTKAQVKDPTLTNETIARQFLPKMKSLLRHWEVDLADPPKKPPYTWPPAEPLADCVKIVQVGFTSNAGLVVPNIFRSGSTTVASAKGGA
ncbi:uncharacterized protein FMAN_15249 [Fusarium mangiferae]|uniref:JmjC domain-containing protein n=1 Tax=Fusarium mangiferae TaxID=192010 RepID=A0A1L7UIU3_FUSMA|nr:uncharacterized protein FMAN_15249 [Fusarium mangiferae]CVL07076.1 uncharacterized protein FMAN_15249 [Fusarium mangiferae]